MRGQVTSNGIRLQRALQQAAIQQTKQQQQDRERESDRVTKLMQEGWDVLPDSGISGPNHTALNYPGMPPVTSGLHSRPEESLPPNSQVIQTPLGTRLWRKQPVDGLPLNEALERGGQPLDANGQVFLGTPTSQLPPDDIGAQAGGLLDRMNAASGAPSMGSVAPPDNQVVQTKNGGRYFIPTEQQREQDKLRIQAQSKEPKPDQWEVDTTHFSQPLMINKSTGETKAITLPDGVARNERPEKEPRREELVDWVRIAADPNSPADEKKRAKDSIALYRQSNGKTDAELRAEQAAQDRKDAATQRRIDTAQKIIESLQQKEQAQHARRQAYGDALTVPNGQPFRDPDSKSTAVRFMDQAQRKSLESRYEQATGLAAQYHSAQVKVHSSIMGNPPEQAGGAPSRIPSAADRRGPRTRQAEQPNAAAPAQGRIRVQLKDGRTGTVDAKDFDASSMSRL